MTSSINLIQSIDELKTLSSLQFPINDSKIKLAKEQVPEEPLLNGKYFSNSSLKFPLKLLESLTPTSKNSRIIFSKERFPSTETSNNFINNFNNFHEIRYIHTITFALIHEIIKRLTERQLLTNIRYLQEYIQKYLEKEISEKIYIQLEEEYDPVRELHIYRFNLFNEEFQPLFVADHYQSFLNLNAYFGYQYLGREPLALLLDIKLKMSMDGHFFSAIDASEGSEEIGEMLKALKREGYFAYFNLTDEKYALIKEISLLWPIEEVELKEDLKNQFYGIVIYRVNEKFEGGIKGDLINQLNTIQLLDLKNFPRRWLDKTVENIYQNILPEVHFYLSMTNKNLNSLGGIAALEYSLLEADYSSAIFSGYNITPVTLHFMILKACRDLNIIQVQDIIVYEDLTIKMNLPSYKEMLRIKNYLLKNLNNFARLRYVSQNNIIDALVYRYYYCLNDKYSLNLIIYRDGLFFVVHDGEDDRMSHIVSEEKLKIYKSSLFRVLQLTEKEFSEKISEKNKRHKAENLFYYIAGYYPWIKYLKTLFSDVPEFREVKRIEKVEKVSKMDLKEFNLKNKENIFFLESTYWNYDPVKKDLSVVLTGEQNEKLIKIAQSGYFNSLWAYYFKLLTSLKSSYPYHVEDNLTGENVDFIYENLI